MVHLNQRGSSSSTGGECWTELLIELLTVDLRHRDAVQGIHQDRDPLESDVPCRIDLVPNKHKLNLRNSCLSR